MENRASLVALFLSLRGLFFCALFLLPAAAQANMVWYGLMLSMRYYAIRPILYGLMIEFIVLSMITDFGVSRLLGATLLMNALSAVTGFVLLPAVTFAVEFLWMTSDPLFFKQPLAMLAAACATVLAAAFANTLVEYPTLLAFKPSTPRVRLFCWIWAANLFSVAIAALSLQFHPSGAHR